MNIKKQLQDLNVNFDGKIAIYYDDLKGNVIKINEKKKYNAASCIKIFILIELFNRIQKGEIDRKFELEYLILTILIKDFKDDYYLSDEYVYRQGRKISNLIFNEYLKLGAKNERSETIGK